MAVVIPALDEERSIGRVIADLPPRFRSRVVVCDNGSTDGTARRAREAGAAVVFEPERGYGAACLRALGEVARHPPDLVVFLDADYSDHPGDVVGLVAPLDRDEADLVIGSRTAGERAPGALTLQARFGNALATRLIAWFFGVRFTDLGPFRAIRWEALERMHMRDRDFGWTVEMQIKAARMGLRCAEVPVSYRRRIGTSKISGTLRGTVLAGRKILWWIFKEALRRRSETPCSSRNTSRS